MKVKFIYELTKKPGTNLYEALEEQHFDDYFIRESEYYFEEADIDKIFRSPFIDWLEKDLSAQSWLEIKDTTGCDGLSDWLLQNHLPGQEERLRRRYAEDEVSHQMTTSIRNKNGGYQPLYLDHIDLNDDVAIALFFNLIAFPPAEDEKDGTTQDAAQSAYKRQIPVDTAQEISALINEANRLAKITGLHVGAPEPKDDLERAADEKIKKLYQEASDLERKTVQSLIRIEGFECNICGGRPRYSKPLPKSDLLCCPSCTHPICPDCANCYDKDPTTPEEAAAYLKSCDQAAGMAYCGQCGDWGLEFMLRFLRLKKCPIPPGYEDKKTEPRLAEYVATSRVAALSDIVEISSTIQKAFNQGISGIIHYQHPTGMIWGIPERHPEGWRVTICYPEER